MSISNQKRITMDGLIYRQAPTGHVVHHTAGILLWGANGSFEYLLEEDEYEELVSAYRAYVAWRATLETKYL